MSTLSLDTRREILEHRIDDLVEEGRFTYFVAGGQSFAGGYAAKRFIRTAPIGYIEDVERQLGKIEDDAMQADRRARSIDGIDEQRQRQEAPLTDEEQAAIDADLERAREVAERQNSTESRLGRIEAILERIAVGLEKR